jgi:hypothetical protein
MKGRDFKALAVKLIGDDDAVIIGDYQGVLHDVRVVPFAGASRNPAEKVFIVIPNFNRPQTGDKSQGPLLPKVDWWPEAPLTWNLVTTVVLRFRDDTSGDTAKEFLRNFFERHSITGKPIRLATLQHMPELWHLFVGDIRARYAQ